MKRLIFILIVFVSVACKGQVPGIGGFITLPSLDTSFTTLMTGRYYIYEYVQLDSVLIISDVDVIKKNLRGSLDGSVLAFGANDGIYVSTDYGYNWTKTDSTQYMQRASVSSTGQYMVAGGYSSGIFVSSNYGTSWTSKAATWSNGFKRSGISADGKYMAVVYSATTANYFSSDYGVTWQSKSYKYTDIAISSTGEYIVACTTTGDIYISNDYGATWTAKSIVEAHRVCAISANGQYIVVMGDGENTRYSSDYGATFSTTYPNGVGTNPALDIWMDATGQYVAVVSSIGLYWSENYGVTFTQLTTTGAGGVFCY